MFICNNPNEHEHTNIPLVKQRGYYYEKMLDPEGRFGLEYRSTFLFEQIELFIFKQTNRNKGLGYVLLTLSQTPALEPAFRVYQHYQVCNQVESLFDDLNLEPGVECTYLGVSSSETDIIEYVNGPTDPLRKADNNNLLIVDHGLLERM